jgi:hypothetical protein
MIQDEEKIMELTYKPPDEEKTPEKATYWMPLPSAPKDEI